MKTQTPAVDTAAVPDVDWDYLRRVAYANCRHMPPWVSRDDLVQEANMAAWRATSRWREEGGSSFTRFVTRRAAGAVRDVMREHQPSTRAGRTRPFFVPLEEGADRSHTEDSVLDTVLDTDLRQTLERALDRLPWRQRHVVVERFLHNRTNGDVGRDLEITGSAVSLIAKGALKRLQQDVNLRDWIGLAA